VCASVRKGGKGAASLDALETPLISELRNKAMLETIAVILVVLWVLGLATSYTMGGFIHILLVLALIVIAVRLIRGQRI
jgi:Family of unknown function (DUF5670)